MAHLRTLMADCGATMRSRYWFEFPEILTLDMILAWDHNSYTCTRMLIIWGQHNGMSATQLAAYGADWEQLCEKYPLTMDEFLQHVDKHAKGIARNSQMTPAVFDELWKRGIVFYHANVIDLDHPACGSARCTSFEKYRGSVDSYVQLRRLSARVCCGVDTSQWTFDAMYRQREHAYWHAADYSNSRNYNIADLRAVRMTSDNFHDQSRVINARCNDTPKNIHRACGLQYMIIFNPHVSTAALSAFLDTQCPSLRAWLVFRAVEEFGYLLAHNTGRMVKNIDLTPTQISLLCDPLKTYEWRRLNPVTRMTIPGVTDATIRQLGEKMRVYDPRYVPDDPELIAEYGDLIYARAYNYMTSDRFAADVFAMAVLYCDDYVAMREELLSVRASADDDDYVAMRDDFIALDGYVAVRASANDEVIAL